MSTLMVILTVVGEAIGLVIAAWLSVPWFERLFVALANWMHPDEGESDKDR